MTYCFLCPICDEQKEVTRPMRDSGLPEVCTCGESMERDYTIEHSSVRGDYNHPITSISMAFDSADVDEHRRRFPRVDLHVDEAGRTAYPILRSRGQKLAYLKGRKWQES